MPYQQILQKYAYQGIFACRIHICDEKSSNSYDFHEKWKKKNRKINNFSNFCSFLEIFTETLEQNIRKSQKICFFRWKRRQIKQKQQIFEKISFIARPMIKLEVFKPYQQILQKYA